jgi:hypothetical protein
MLGKMSHRKKAECGNKLKRRRRSYGKTERDGETGFSESPHEMETS